MFGKKFFSTTALGGAVVSLIGNVGGSTTSAEYHTKEEILSFFDFFLEQTEELGSEGEQEKVFALKKYIKNLSSDLLNDNYRYMGDSHSPDAVEKDSDFIYFPDGHGNWLTGAMILGKCDFCCGKALDKESKVLTFIYKLEDGRFNHINVWFN